MSMTSRITGVGISCVAAGAAAYNAATMMLKVGITIGMYQLHISDVSFLLSSLSAAPATERSTSRPTCRIKKATQTMASQFLQVLWLFASPPVRARALYAEDDPARQDCPARSRPRPDRRTF